VTPPGQRRLRRTAAEAAACETSPRIRLCYCISVWKGASRQINDCIHLLHRPTADDIWCPSILDGGGLCIRSTSLQGDRVAILTDPSSGLHVQNWSRSLYFRIQSAERNLLGILPIVQCIHRLSVIYLQRWLESPIQSFAVLFGRLVHHTRTIPRRIYTKPLTNAYFSKFIPSCQSSVRNIRLISKTALHTLKVTTFLHRSQACMSWFLTRP